MVESQMMEGVDMVVRGRGRRREGEECVEW